MKKLIWISVLLSLLASDMYCQKLESGSLTCLKGESQLNVIIDFSQSKIDGLSEQDFIWKMGLKDSRGSEWEEYWKKDCYKQFFGKFCLSAFEETEEIGLKLGSFPEAKYTAILQLETVDDDGEINGRIRIVETETEKEKAVIMKLNGDGGRWGSIENLIGDAMERAGEKTGRFIRKNINNASVESTNNEQVRTGTIPITNGDEKQLAVRFPDTISTAYNAFRTSSIYNMSKKDKASNEQSFILEIENDLNNVTTWEDLEIISTKIKFLDQYSAIQHGIKDRVESLKNVLNKQIKAFE